jgi:polysaccharide chain length determinant protein (PEP-CTERM system associated)
MADLISQLLSFLSAIWKYKWYSMPLAWAVLLTGGVIIYQLPNDFQASARVYVDTQSILKPLLSGMTTVPNDEQQVSIMSRTLLSRPNIERVMRMTDLDIKAKTSTDRENIIENLTTKIKITQTGRDDIYTITYNSENPKLGKDIVQSLLTIFVEGSVGDKKQDSDKAVQFINDQIKTYEDKLSTTEGALRDFKQKNAGLLPREGGDYGSKLQESADILSQARLELAEAEQSSNALQRQTSGGAGNDGQPTLTPEIDARIQLANKRLDELRMQFTEQHPDVIGAKRLIAELEKRKLEEIKTGTRGADPGASYSPMLQQLSIALTESRAKVAGMRARVEEYTSRYARLKAQSMNAPEVEAEFTQLNRNYKINKDNYEKLVGRRDAAKLSGDLSSVTDLLTFRVIDPPTVPRVPTGPNRLKLFSMVFVAALGAGVGLALLLGQIRPSFMTQAELESSTGFPVLGSIAMYWNDAQKVKQKHTRIFFASGFVALVLVYAGAMTLMLLRG